MIVLLHIMGFLDGIFGKGGNDKFLGVDIGSSSIKVVQLSKQKGVVTLDTFGEISLSPYGGKEIGQSVKLEVPKMAEALKDLLKEAQCDATSAGLAIPLKSSLVFNMKMPIVDESQLDEMVRLEARRYIPVPISEVSLDWSVIPTEEDPEAKAATLSVLVVAIHKETLNKYKEIAVKAGLDLQFMEIETFSTIRSVVKHDNNSVLILDIGASATKLYIVEYGIIQKSHIIGVGSQNMIRSLETRKRLSNIKGDLNATNGVALSESMKKSATTPVDLDRILNETNKIIFDYQKSHQKNIEEVILTGGGSILKGIMPHVKNTLEAEIIAAHPFEKAKTPAFLEETLKDAGPEFSVSIGLALRGLG